MEDPKGKTSQDSTKRRRRRVMWQCPVCGSHVWVSNKKRHLGTKKHNDANYVLTEKYEILR